MERTVFLMRHARAAPPGGGSDAERPLTPDGAEDAARVARLLAGLRRPPRAVFSSPARRCLETAGSVASALGALEVQPRPELALDASVEDARALVRSAGDRALLVSHQPELLALAAALLHPGPLGADFAPGAVLALDGAGDGIPWTPTLLVDPRHLR